MNTVTKSIRLTPAESEEIAMLSAQSAISEATLMKKWVLDGLQAYKLNLALQAYMDRRVDLRNGAQMAGVSYNRFLHEIESRNIVVLDDEGFLDQLAFLAERFESEPLKRALSNAAVGAG
ncbi:MAG: hypothetical protein ACK47M_13220 [Caldilinea sp.]